VALREMLSRSGTCFALGVLALAVVGCGDSGNEVSSTQPTIPRQVAEELAASADEIARLLDQGDKCAAADKTLELKRATSRAIRNGSVPPELRGTLQATVRDLAKGIDCNEDEQGTTSETVSTSTTTTGPADATTTEPTTTTEPPSETTTSATATSG
jgi:hypothetical protein